MALQSKSISANGSNGNHKFTLTVTEDSTSTSGNSSSISWKFVLSPVKNNYDWVYSNTVPVTYTVTINGTNYTGNIMSYDGTSTVTIKSGTNTITHNTDGSKSISYSFSVSSISASYLPGSASASGSMTLTTIARYATSVQSLKSKTSSSITMNWSSDSTIDYIWYSSNNGSSWTGVDVTDGTSGSYTISGLAANTTYNIKTRVRRKDSQLTTDSSALSVTTHAKTVPTISLSSRTSSSITVTSSCNVAVSTTYYRIKTSSGSYGSYQTSATFSGLAANTTYIVEVYKVGSASGEAGTATITVTTHQKTIPTISLSSKTVNSITVTHGGNVYISYVQFRIKENGGSYGSYQTSTTFLNLKPNTTYIIEVYAIGRDSGEAGTATLTVTTYNCATITSCTDFNLGDSTSMSYSNPSGSTVNVGIYMTDNSTALAEYRVPSGTSYTFNFTDAELDTMYKKMGTGNTLTGRFFIRTTCNGINYYDTIDKTITLKGNQKTAHVGVNGVQKRAKVYLGVNGSVKRAVMWIGNNGGKRCI